MPYLSGCHNHSTHCDSKHTLREMLEAARELGFTSFGFSGHAPMGFETRWSMSPQEQQQYFAQARLLQKESGFPRLWIGLELDALADEASMKAAKADADYLLGSTHYLPFQSDGCHVAVDGTAEALRAHCDRWYAGDGLALAEAYYQVESDFVHRIRPDVIGHFDLVRKYAGVIGLFDETDPAYRKIALSALERCYFPGAILEVNTGGMARGYLPTPYPTFELLCAWREMGGEVTLASDCHDKTLLTFGYDQAEALIRKAGYRRILQLGSQNTLWENYELS